MCNTAQINFIQNHLNRPLVLVGMMGCGKTSLGQKLARQLDLPFWDSDALIEEKAGRSVSEIFEHFGEEKFRDSELRTIQELLAQGPCVIATGGGAPMNDVLWSSVEEYALSIWLKAELDVIWPRIQDSQTRPLLQKDNPKAILADLIEQRTPRYAQSNIVVETIQDRPHETLESLIKSLYEQLKTDSV